jgi:phosphatidylglycerophosphatase A
MPGTITSLVVFSLLFFVLRNLSLECKIGILLLVILIHFTIYSTFLDITDSLNSDPGIYTLDETVAIVFIWLILGETLIKDLLFVFLLFRFFDIFKPFGISKIERIMQWSPSLRNLADDILAILYTLVVFKLFLFYAE